MEQQNRTRNQTQNPPPHPTQPPQNGLYGVYTSAIITTKVSLHIREIGKNLKQNLEEKIAYRVSNKCIPEGYVKPNSVQVQSYSAGLIAMSEYIEYQVVYQCMICFPVEGMIVRAKVKHITKAGLHCSVTDEDGNTPIIVFIIREHNVTDEAFHTVKEGDEIQAKIIGIQFELNDPYISTIGAL